MMLRSNLMVLATLVVSLCSASAEGALIQYLKLDGNGTAVTGNSATAGGIGGAPTAAIDRNGNAGGAIQFTAGGDVGGADGNYYSIAGGGGLNNASAGTLSFWVHWDNPGTQNAGVGSVGAVLARQSNSVFSSPVFSLSSASLATARLRFAPGPTTGSSADYGVVGANTWRNIVLAYEPGTGVTNNYQLYMDGVLQGTLTNAARFSNNAAIPLTLGAFIDNGDSYSTSKMDDFGVFEQHLDAPHVSAIRSLSVTTALQYDLDTVSELFDLYTAQTGIVTAGDLDWRYGTGINTGLGQVVLSDDQYFLQLDASGFGIRTIGPVPEPSSALLLIGLIGMFKTRRRKFGK